MQHDDDVGKIYEKPVTPQRKETEINKQVQSYFSQVKQPSNHNLKSSGGGQLPQSSSAVFRKAQLGGKDEPNTNNFGFMSYGSHIWGSSALSDV